MYLKSVFPPMVFSWLHEKPTGKIRQNHLYGEGMHIMAVELRFYVPKFCQILIDFWGEEWKHFLNLFDICFHK